MGGVTLLWWSVWDQTRGVCGWSRDFQLHSDRQSTVKHNRDFWVIPVQRLIHWAWNLIFGANFWTNIVINVFGYYIEGCFLCIVIVKVVGFLDLSVFASNRLFEKSPGEFLFALNLEVKAPHHSSTPSQERSTTSLTCPTSVFIWLRLNNCETVREVWV